MNLFDILLPYQKSFVQAPQKKKLFLSGRQLGKSTVLSWIASYKVLTSQLSNPLALIISANQRSASEFLKKVVQVAEAVHILQPDITYSASSDCIRFSNGARIMSLPSGNPQSLRGFSVKGGVVLIDEIGYIERPEDVWSAIIPTLTRDQNSELIVASTATGKDSFFYDLYCKALDDPTWYVQTTTIEDAVKDGLPVDIATLKNTILDPEAWEREYMCVFASSYGAMLDLDLLEFADPPQDTSNLPHWLGMDVGSQSDRTAITDIVQLPDKTFFVNDIIMLNKASYEHQLEILKAKNQVLKFKAGFIDQNGIGSALAEFATKQVSSRIKGYTWTSANKTPAYEDMRAMVFDHKLKFNANLKELVRRDIGNVHRIVNEAGKVSYSAGRDATGHSDATSSIVLAIQAAKQFPVQISLPTGFGFPSRLG